MSHFGLTGRERAIWEDGFLHGNLLRQPEVDRANADADRFYRAAFDSPEKQRRRIDSAFAEIDREFFAQAEQRSRGPDRPRDTH